MILTHGINSLPRGGGGSIDPDIIILQDWVTQDVGLQPTGGWPSSGQPTPSYDPDGPLDVSGTGWSGTPFVNNQDLGWSYVQVPSNAYSTDFHLYAQNQLRYEEGLEQIGLYTLDKDFTIEAWLRLTHSRGNLSYLRSQPLIGLFNETSMCCFGLRDSGIGYWDWDGMRYSQFSALSGWHHYAIVVHNNVAKMFIDGVSVNGAGYPISPSTMTSFIIAKFGYVNWSGSRVDMARYDYAQICLTKRAKWTEDFTPPTRPYCLGE